ncbi:MAG TPA: hypothetical protein VHM19_17805, partial [Polyangiales bacterium]|nr:hypothetical protein [Polyangiales bacterium]
MMDCKHCETLLLDLAYGELSAELDAEARAHVASCAQCGPALSRIQSGLQLAERMPIDEPPVSLSDRLMEAARARAAQNEQARSAASVPAWLAFAEWLRRFAMVRQVQMAIVTLLIVGVGVWSVPLLTRKPSSSGETVVSPDHEGEAAPSAALQPAKPLDIEVDPYTRRIRAKGERDDSLRARPEAAKEQVAAENEPAGKAEGADLAPAPSEPAANELDDKAVAEVTQRAAAPEEEARAEKKVEVSSESARALNGASADELAAAAPAKGDSFADGFAPAPPAAAAPAPASRSAGSASGGGGAMPASSLAKRSAAA